MNSQIYYGTIRAEQTQRGPLESLGITLGAYDVRARAYPARADTITMRTLDQLSEEYPHTMYARAVDAAGTCQSPTATVEMLRAEQAYALFMASQLADGGRHWQITAGEIADQMRTAPYGGLQAMAARCKRTPRLFIGAGGGRETETEWAMVSLTADFVQRVRDLQHVMSQHGLSRIERPQAPDAWEHAKEWRPHKEHMVLTPETLRFEASSQWNGDAVRTHAVPTEQLFRMLDLELQANSTTFAHVLGDLYHADFGAYELYDTIRSEALAFDAGTIQPAP